jgi:hypothetical protein
MGFELSRGYRHIRIKAVSVGVGREAMVDWSEGHDVLAAESGGGR